MERNLTEGREVGFWKRLCWWGKRSVHVDGSSAMAVEWMAHVAVLAALSLRGELAHAKGRS